MVRPSFPEVMGRAAGGICPPPATRRAAWWGCDNTHGSVTAGGAGSSSTYDSLSKTAMTSADLLVFETLRPRLFQIAYRMLGMRADAEDIVQDAWLRFSASRHDAVRSA